MTDKFENIDSEEIKLTQSGELEISASLQDAVAGGFDPETEEDEARAINTNCEVTNNKGCN
jgi:hypothetical protein